MSEQWNIDYDSGFNSGLEFKQKHIIKLLEEHELESDEGFVTDDFIAGFLKAIALIKGENN